MHRSSRAVAGARAPLLAVLPDPSRGLPAPGTDVDHALAPARPAMTRPSVLRAVRAQVAVHVEVLVSALQHLPDAVRGGLESFDCLPLEHPYERAQVNPIRFLQGIEGPRLLQRGDHRCRLASPGEYMAHEQPRRASVPVFERVDLHERVVQPCGFEWCREAPGALALVVPPDQSFHLARRVVRRSILVDPAVGGSRVVRAPLAGALEKRDPDQSSGSVRSTR